MIRDDEFYGISDVMHYNVYASLLKDHIIKEERVIIKVFQKEGEIVVIENNHGNDIILKDTRQDKNTDLMTFDLTFLKTLERYYSDYEIPGMVYEMIDGIGSWYRVKIEGFHPTDSYLKPFFLKKKIDSSSLKKYVSNEEEEKKINQFYDITKGLIKFSKKKDLEEFFFEIEK